MELGTRLKELRRARGISQEELAQAIHISRSAVAKWENGLGHPGADSLRLLADYFGCTPEELLGRPPEPGPRKPLWPPVLAAAAVGAALVAGLMCWAPLRANGGPLVLGAILLVLGLFNLRGNIASVHWYNRRKVKGEDQLPYCRWVGGGTAVIGGGVMLYGLLHTLWPMEWTGYVLLALLAAGLGMILFAQFRYNRGIF